MAGKEYSSIEEYVSDLEAVLPEAVLIYVAPKVEKILLNFTWKNVYRAANEAGRPIKGGWINHQTYRCRFLLPKSIVSQFEDNELTVTSNANPSPSILGDNTYGEDGGFYDLLELKGSPLSAHPISGMFPRPVIGPAQKYVDMITPSLQNALIKGLNEMM